MELVAFEEELNGLKELIIKMGVLVQELIHQSVEALQERNLELAKEVIKKDMKVDRLELEINETGINMIALRQPKAYDLRFITTALRIATDLERIGDLAEDVAERAIELNHKPLLKPLIDIPQMAALAQKAISLVLDAFINKDASVLKEVWKIETEVDLLRDAIHDELLEIMAKDPQTVERATPLLLISRHLERACGHVTNIAEDIVYLVKGKFVKHGGSENNE